MPKLATPKLLRDAQAFFDTLKRITCYQSPEQLRRNCWTQFGLDYHEALEMAYENVLAEARAAVVRRRRPKES